MNSETIQTIERKARLIRELQALIEDTQTEIDALKADIQNLMGDREALRAGEYRITWKPVKSVRLDSAALKKAIPDVAAAFMRETTTRRFCVA